MPSTSQDPVLLLSQIERRAREHASGLPQQQDVEQTWSGIGFRIGTLQLLAPLGEITEILSYPVMSRVPGTKSWVLGIANVRGNLLPIMDLAGYLYGRPATLQKRSRVLVINQQGVFAGLLVDDVLGLRHLPLDTRAREVPKVDLAVVPYVDQAYRADGQVWVVFSMRKLAESPLFLQVAV